MLRGNESKISSLLCSSLLKVCFLKFPFIADVDSAFENFKVDSKNNDNSHQSH